MTLGTNIEHTRAYNRRVVLDILRRHGPLSRTDVSKRSALTLQGVSNIMSDLRTEDLVITLGRRSGGRGQPPVQFAINPAGAVSIGVSVERDRLVAARIDASGKIEDQLSVQSGRPTPEDGLEAIAELVRSALTRMDDERRARLCGIGVALPAVVDEHSGSPLRMVSHPAWEGFPFRDRLSSILELPVTVGNDAILAALGEQWFGSGRTFENFFYVLLSKGFGSSHMLNGEPSGGIWGVSGRMGHIPVEPNGRFCPSCGETGCLSLYTSLNALLSDLDEHGIRVDDVDDLVALHAEGAPPLMAWMDAAARYLARGLVALENLVASDAILFGGRMPEPILRDLTERVTELYRGRPVKSAPELPQLLNSRAGADGVVLGAGTLPLFLRFAPNLRLVLQQAAREAPGPPA